MQNLTLDPKIIIMQVENNTAFRYHVLLGYELLRVLLPPRGNFVDHVLLRVYHLTSFLKHVSPLAVGAVGAFGCYSVLITLPLKSQNTNV